MHLTVTKPEAVPESRPPPPSARRDGGMLVPESARKLAADQYGKDILAAQ
eukprot:COSAG05_NODE_13830_length_417_cov_0.540881_1_plen_49_part_10